jgi:hypothetical protein
MPTLSRRHLVTTAAAARPSRRAMFALAAGAAALPALPAIVAAYPVEVVPLPAGSTVIAKLWLERNKAKRAVSRAEKAIDKLKLVLIAQMPKPDPSIVYSPENDADGLRFYLADKGTEPWSFNRYIASRDIKIAIDCASRTCSLIEKEGDKTIIYDDRKTEPDQELLDRLNARLKLSIDYERKIERAEKRIGLTAMQRKSDMACSRQCKIEHQIERLPAQTRGDMRIKFAIVDYYSKDDKELGASYIPVRQLRRLIEAGDALPA